MDDVEDKSGAQIRIAGCARWFSCALRQFGWGRRLRCRVQSKEFENSTHHRLLLVGCFVGFWFLQIGFSIAPAWLDVSASRG